MHSSAVARLRSRRDGVTERRLCFLAIGDNGASTLTFHALPSPSAASKFLALLVALVALSTANAATLSGSASGVQYTTSSDTSAEEAFSTAISGDSYWTNFATEPGTAAGTSYDNDIKSHVDALSGTTWDMFRGSSSPGFGSDDAVVKTYIDEALVSPDFKT